MDPFTIISAALAAANLAAPFFGKKESSKKFETLSPQQEGLQNQLIQMLAPLLQQGQIGKQPLFQQGQNYLQNLLQGDENSFKRFEAPFMRQFNEEIIPQLAEKFAGLGAGSSSGFQQALGQAGAGLSERLAQLRSGLQFGAVNPALQYANAPFAQGQSLLGAAFQPRFNTGISPAGPGAFAQGLAPINQAYGQYVGNKFGGNIFG